MKNTRNKDREKDQTPIMDGDARPDKMIEPDAASVKKNKKRKEKESDVTSGRSADVNSLEDYKDAN
jgi:hypothetical protein